MSFDRSQQTIQSCGTWIIINDQYSLFSNTICGVSSIIDDKVHALSYSDYTLLLLETVDVGFPPENFGCFSEEVWPPDHG